MKNRAMPVTLIVIILLFLLTGFTVVFITDFYSAYGSHGGSTFDEAAIRSPLYGTKALDAEAVREGFERTKALTEFTVTSTEDILYGLSRYSLPGTVSPDENCGSSIESPAPGDQSDRDTEILYVVYSESLTKSGGF